MIDETLTGIETERARGAWTITLARPPHNILDLEMIESLDRRVAEAEAAGAPALVLRARGRQFSAGVDVRDHLDDKVNRMLALFDGLLSRLLRYPGFTISVVEGGALGGGCELACVCDQVLATEAAAFGLPEIKLGVFPPFAMTLFPRMIGTKRTAELVLTGRTIHAREALEYGLATKVVRPEDVEAAIQETLHRIRALSPEVLHLAKKTLRDAEALSFQESLALVEETYRNKLMRLPDAAEGLRAFIEKRPPRWGANRRRES